MQFTLGLGAVQAEKAAREAEQQVFVPDEEEPPDVTAASTTPEASTAATQLGSHSEDSKPDAEAADVIRSVAIAEPSGHTAEAESSGAMQPHEDATQLRLDTDGQAAGLQIPLKNKKGGHTFLLIYILCSVIEFPRAIGESLVHPLHFCCQIVASFNLILSERISRLEQQHHCDV